MSWVGNRKYNLWLARLCANVVTQQPKERKYMYDKMSKDQEVMSVVFWSVLITSFILFIIL